MSEAPAPQPEGKERRDHARYEVDLQANAVRMRNRLLPSVPAKVSITVKDISQVALRWHSKDVFYRGELVGINLAEGKEGLNLRCVVRVFRTRRVTGHYEVVGFFLKVARGEAEGGAEGDEAGAPGQPAAASTT